MRGEKVVDEASAKKWEGGDEKGNRAETGGGEGKGDTGNVNGEAER